MKKTSTVRFAAVAATALVSVGLVRAAYAPGTNLYINGTLTSSHVFQHDGMACVPIADIAKSMNLAVAKKADGYSIAEAGGTGQVEGHNGKIGEKLTCGQWNLTVVKAFRTDKYVHQFDTGDSTPGATTDDLVVVVLHVKNALHDAKGFSLAGTGKTAVTDVDEHSYGKMTFGGGDWRAGYPTLLPGSADDFALCFSVPKTEKLDSFVYEFYPTEKGEIFRVSLKPLNP